MKPSPSSPNPSPSRLGWWLALPPICAVLAGVATLILALSNPDPVVQRNVVKDAQARHQWPAQMARNHVVTPMPSDATRQERKP
jgi:hypothetical protein